MTHTATLDALSIEMLGVFRRHELVRRTDAPISSITTDEAYDVQDLFIAQRIFRAGERAAGYKVGCTSPAIREQFDLDQPIAGRVMHPHVHTDGAVIDIGRFIRCAVEPELVLRVGRDIDDPDADDAALRSAIAGVSAGIEVHEYTFFYGEPTSHELIASNGIHACLVTHPQRLELGDIDLCHERIDILVNGELRASGTGADIMGDPIASLRWLVGHLSRRGRRLESGSLVIPGSATPLIPVAPGDAAESRFSSFGTCRVSFE